MFMSVCACVCVCVCVSGRKTPLIRCHVVLEAVTCQGSSRYLSVTTRLLCVCGWLGTLHLNTHSCCSSTARTTERSAIKMTLIVKHNNIQRCFRSFPTLGQGWPDFRSRQLSWSQRVILHLITNRVGLGIGDISGKPLMLARISCKENKDKTGDKVLKRCPGVHHFSKL